MTNYPALPTVSIIIPSHNGMEYLQECLPSLGHVIYPSNKMQTILVDDGSTDQTSKLIPPRFPRVKMITNSERSGFVKSIQAGAEAAKGEILVFLNNDTRVEPEWLEALVGALSPSEGVVCACSHILSWDGSYAELVGRDLDAFAIGDRSIHRPSENLKDGAYILFASGGSMAITRSVYFQLAGFDRDYNMYHEDVDFGWRLWLLGYRIRYARNSVLYHKIGTTARTMDQDERHKFRLRNLFCTMIRNLDSNNLTNLLPAVASFVSYRAIRDNQLGTLSNAITEIVLQMETLLEKRRIMQAERKVSDYEIFSKVGHPFGFLLTSKYIKKPVSSSVNDEGHRIIEVITNSLLTELKKVTGIPLNKQGTGIDPNNRAGILLSINSVAQYYERHVIGFRTDPLSLLLSIYYKRSDLQHAFPEVQKGNIANLINWAASTYEKMPELEKNRGWYESEVDHYKQRREASLSDPLGLLLAIYYAREDLRTAFPEVLTGYYRRLIAWATTTPERIPTVEKNAAWYRNNEWLTLDKQLDQTRTELSQRESNIQTLTDERSRLKDELNQATTQLSQRESNVQTLEGELEKLKTDLADRSSRIESLQAEKAGLRSELESIRSSFSYRVIRSFTTNIDRACPDGTKRGKLRKRVVRRLRTKTRDDTERRH